MNIHLNFADCEDYFHLDENVVAMMVVAAAVVKDMNELRLNPADSALDHRKEDVADIWAIAIEHLIFASEYLISLSIIVVIASNGSLFNKSQLLKEKILLPHYPN